MMTRFHRIVARRISIQGKNKNICETFSKKGVIEWCDGSYFTMNLVPEIVSQALFWISSLTLYPGVGDLVAAITGQAGNRFRTFLA